MQNTIKIAEAVMIKEIQDDIKHIKEDVAEIKAKLEANYVTKEEFKPVKAIAYGVVSLLLTGVVGAILAVALNRGN